MVGRQTASKYLEKIVQAGLLSKVKMGRDNYYVNTRLVNLFVSHNSDVETDAVSVESITQ